MRNTELETKFKIKLEKTSNPKNQFKIQTEVDENDGDYLLSESLLSVEKFEIILPVIKAINTGELNSFGDSKRDDYVMPDECEDLFYDIAPSSEYGGHDLCICSLIYYDENGNSFDVIL